MTTEQYLTARSAELDTALPGDCLDEVCRTAGLLAAEARAPWIGRIRDLRREGDALISAMLAPRRFAGRGFAAWTTHYVCCSGPLVFDPIAGAALPEADYATSVFGRPLTIEPVLDAAATAAAMAAGELRARLREIARQPAF